MEIKRLPENVKSIIQSGVVITDACQCVLELIYNSIDSKATAIAVRIDLKKFYIQVVDNGSGICYEDLKILGNRYITSKCSSLEDLENNLLTYGYRGIALASMVDMCDQVEIQSRHSSCHTYSRVLKSGGSNEITENQRTRPTRGTTITVVNFMVSMPVRRKRIKEVFDLDFILQQLEALSTIHYSVSKTKDSAIVISYTKLVSSHGTLKSGHDARMSFFGISFSLRNDTTGKVILQTHRRNNLQQSLLDQFGLSMEKNLIPVNYREGPIEVSGFVSRHLHTDSSIQLLYVNNRVIHNPKIQKLILDLIKKYGKFWEKDRVNPEEIIDVNGFVYIIKIQCPYMIYSMSRNGRKTIVEFRNSEDVLKCIIRAIKSRLKEENNTGESDVSVYFVNPEKQAKQIGNPVFGPSQMNNVVHGRLVSRLDHCQEYIVDPQEKKENTEERLDAVVTPSSVLQRYQKAFFNENNKDGSNIPDHVPIFEMRDFSNIPFHEFIAWLDMKAKRDNNAFQLLSELKSGNMSNNTENSVAIVSLKDMRKNKLVATSKLMLKKIQEIRYSQKRRGVLENYNKITPEIFNRVTRTTFSSNYPQYPILSVVSTENKNSFEFPQVNFSEFLNWLKVRTIHNRTVEKFLGDFFSAKGYKKVSIPPHVSIKELRKEKLNKLNNNFLTSLKKTQTVKRSLPLSTDNKVKKKRTVLQEIRNSVVNTGCNNHNSPLVLTWKSHYRTDSFKDGPENLPVREFDTNIPHHIVKDKDNPYNPHLSCDENLRSFQEFINISKIDQTGDDLRVLNSAHEQLVSKMDFTEQNFRKEFNDIGIQACSNIANASTQVDSNKVLVSSETQTDEKCCGLDKEVQTTFPENISKEVVANELCVKAADTSSSELPEVLKATILDLSPSIILRNSLPDTVPVISGWEEKFDNCGRKYYVHSSSGFSIFDPPMSSTRSSFPISIGHPTTVASKNFGQVQNVISDSCHDDLSDVKWQDGNKDDVIDPILKMLQDASDEVTTNSEIISAKIPKQLINSHKLLSSIVFSKELLTAAKVIGQLDRKFIVALIPKEENSKCTLVCLFDQHGIHERITLEKLLKIYQKDEECESESLQIPLTLAVPLSTYNMFLSEELQFNKQGLFGVAQNTSSLKVTSVPACFVRQQEREIKAYKKPSLIRKVADLVGEITDHLCETRGAGLFIPKTIMAVIASEACRSAVKFNQSLTFQEMSKMIAELSLCNMPFQCAHGRPSIAPIFELDESALTKNETKLNFKKMKKNK